MKPVKFVQITRTIGPKTGIHFLDAISDEGEHYTAEMSPHIEEWLCYVRPWKKDSQQPKTPNQLAQEHLKIGVL